MRGFHHLTKGFPQFTLKAKKLGESCGACGEGASQLPLINNQPINMVGHLVGCEHSMSEGLNASVPEIF